MPNSALPEHLKGKLHKDYTWPFSYIPRALTSFKWTQPPRLLIGRKVYDWTSRKYKDKQGKWVTLRGPDPSQKTPWAWALTWPLHFTITFGKSGKYSRAGARWDSVDEYYTCPALDLKEVDGGLNEEENLRISYRGYSRHDKD